MSRVRFSFTKLASISTVIFTAVCKVLPNQSNCSKLNSYEEQVFALAKIFTADVKYQDSGTRDFLVGAKDLCLGRGRTEG